MRIIMQDLLHWIMSPGTGNEELDRRVRAANLMALFVMLAVPLVMLIETLVGNSPFVDPLSFIYLLASTAIALISLALTRLRRYQAGIYWLLTTLMFVMVTSTIPYGLSAANFTILAAVIILAAMLAGGRGIALTVVGSLVATITAYLVGQGDPTVDLYSLRNEVMMQFAIFPLLGLLTWLFHRSLTNLAHQARQQTQDIAELNIALEQRVAELLATGQQLEQTIAQGEYRAQRLAMAAQTSRVLSAILEPTDILHRVVTLLHEQFDFYYVGIFILDSEHQYVELRAGTGEAGQQMVAQGYKLPVGGTSAVGWCVANRQGRIAPSMSATDGKAKNLLLPETSSELALPLISRGELLGALSVHSIAEDAFDQEYINILQSVSDQVANAIVSTRLLTQTQEALEEARRAQQRYLREGWERFLPTRQITGYQYHDQAVQALSHRLLPEVRQAVSANQTQTPSSDSGATLVTPLVLRGEVIGALGLQDGKRRDWTPEEIAMTRAIADQVALAVETARLFEEAQASVAEVTATYQRYIRAAWSDYVPVQPTTLFEHAAEALPPVKPEVLPGVKQAMQQAAHTVDTSAELTTLAVPLTLRGQVLGVLGFQDDPDRQWSEEELAVVEAVAEQMALAVENTRLFDEAQARLADAESTHRRYLREAWDEYLPTRPITDFQFTAPGNPPLDSVKIPEVDQALVQKHVTTTAPSADHAALITPIVLRGEVLGALGLQDDDATRHWADEELELVEAIAEELGQAIESARLFGESQYRAIQLETAAEVSRTATALLDFEALGKEVVHLLQQRFSLYYVGLFLLDETREYAVLRAGTGDAGRQMLAEGHHRRVGDYSLIGSCTADAQARITLDKGADSTRLDNPLLPNTRTELALPLISRGQVIGALSIQSDRSQAFTDADVTVFQTIAYQLANAIENARAYQELQDTAEQLQEMDKLKSQFLANMSHELRTPLNAIIGFSRVILKGIDGPLTDAQRTDLTAVYENGQHLLELINNVLDISKIQAGRMELASAPVDLRPVIQGVLSTAIALVKDKDIQLHQEIQEDLPIVQGDERALRQVILNLVSNATKFTDKGSITLRAWGDAEQVTISVTDTGIGIAPEHQGLIFEEFRQVDGSLTRQAGGTGLGLPISRHLVEEHGGRIWVESTLGEGATFSFTVPVVRDRQIQLPEEVAHLDIDPSRRLLLVVDSQEGVVDIYKRYLEKHGYQVIGLHEGAKALDWARGLQPFAIIQDLSLPDKNGWAVLEEIKSAPETRAIPVIIGTLDRDNSNLALQRGAAAYLIKPVLEKDLLGALNPLESRQGDES